MKLPLCILLCLGLSAAASRGHAAHLAEAAASLRACLDVDTVQAGDTAPQAPGPTRWRHLGRSRLAGGERAAAMSAFPFATAPSAMTNGLDGADGNVLSMAQAGNTLYIAGSFRSVGTNTGGCVAFDIRTGQPTTWFPKVAGAVNAIVPDGEGGWFIGGEFSGVGGKPRGCLAHVRADGSVADWSPSVTGSPGYIDPPAVYALAIAGDRLFVGGAFRMIGGEPHENLGCVDLRSGAALPWNLDTDLEGYISGLVVHKDTLLVGGHFLSVGGVNRSGLTAVNTSNGAVLPWRVDLYGGANVLLASGDTLYVGGDFTDIGGWGSSKLAAASISQAAPLPIDFRFWGVWQQYAPLLQVDALAKVADTLYVGGNFTRLGGQDRISIAAVSARTGDAVAWVPDTVGPRYAGWPPPLCTTLCVDGGSLFAGGYFRTAGGSYHPYLAGWDRRTGEVLDWTPTPDDVPTAFLAKGDSLLVGGLFHLVNSWQHRAGLAAIDLGTGHVKPWNPNPNGRVCTAVAVRGSQVYVSGDFSQIGGDPQPRSFIAALDTINGEVTPWNPGANDVAMTFLVEGDTVYTGGYFTQIGVNTRNFVAALDASSGEVLPWDPNADYPVLALARTRDVLVLGGLFSSVGSQPRAGLAEVDPGSGMVNEWNPGTDNRTVKALLASGSTVYVGGAFGAVGGVARNAIAAVDAETGSVSPWYPAPTAWGVPTEVKALALRDTVLYLGGAFATINGEPRICLTGVSTASSLPTSWDPGLDGYVWSLLSSEDALHVGGGFSRAGGMPSDGLASFSLSEPPPSPPPAFSLSRCVPNPARASTTFRFELAASARTNLWIFDIQGRRVATPLTATLLLPGSHSLPVDVSRLHPGLYFARLEAGERSATAKLLVVH